MAEIQPGVAQEIERQVRMAPDAGAATTERRAERVEGRCTDIRQFPALEVAPDQFDGVQLRGITRQALDAQPRSLLHQVTAHPPTLMSGQPVPDQDDRLSREMPLEVPQEGDQRAIGVAARLCLKEEPGAAPIPSEGQRAGNRQPLPVAADMRQDGRFPPRRPRSADDGLLREAAFVLEDDPGPSAPGVFFSCSQRRVFQVSIACSFRSRARRVGRCSDQPSPRSTRQTWPGWCRTRVSRSISSATRGKVQRSVLNPCARGPFRSARSTPASCAASNRGFRPARPAPLSPARPWAFHAWNQWCALTRVTPNAFATATCDSPRANSRAARSRRVSIAAKSRAVIGMLQHAIVPVNSVSLFSEIH
jgi:hypothetical protein